ncbi:MAG: NUDIX domain-containing protein [Anaerolineae bacterium]
MITFDVGGVRFVYRTVGVAIDGGRVLLHQADGDDFWSMPGGRVEPLEPSPDALRREMREEIGVAVRVERLLWVVENFYRHEALAYHELALFYLMSFPPESPCYTQSEFWGEEDGNLRLRFRWHARNALETVPLYPTFLRRALRAIPAAPVHVIHTDTPM